MAKTTSTFIDIYETPPVIDAPSMSGDQPITTAVAPVLDVAESQSAMPEATVVEPVIVATPESTSTVAGIPLVEASAVIETVPEVAAVPVVETAVSAEPTANEGAPA